MTTTAGANTWGSRRSVLEQRRVLRFVGCRVGVLACGWWLPLSTGRTACPGDITLFLPALAAIVTAAKSGGLRGADNGAVPAHSGRDRGHSAAVPGGPRERAGRAARDRRGQEADRPARRADRERERVPGVGRVRQPSCDPRHDHCASLLRLHGLRVDLSTSPRSTFAFAGVLGGVAIVSQRDSAFGVRREGLDRWAVGWA